MYSPAVRPSRVLAPPAKKRKLSIVRSISSGSAETGLPTLADSMAVNSSLWSSMTWAMRSNASARWRGVVVDHDSNALAAACTARSTSAAPDAAARKITSPVAGSVMSSRGPVSGSPPRPPIQLRAANSGSLVIGEPPSGRGGGPAGRRLGHGLLAGQTLGEVDGDDRQQHGEEPDGVDDGALV